MLLLLLMMLKNSGMTLKNNIHSCTISAYGDWRMSDESQIIDLGDIEHLLTKKRLKMINHDRIGWKGMHFPREELFKTLDRKRYDDCDIVYPCILVENAANPYNKKYRMIDGKHRIAKMRQMGIHRSLFYVLQPAKIERYLKPKL